MKRFLTKFIRIVLRWSSRESRTLCTTRNSTAMRNLGNWARRTASLRKSGNRNRMPPRRRIFRHTIIRRKNIRRIAAETAAVVDVTSAEVVTVEAVVIAVAIADAADVGDVVEDVAALDTRR